MMAAGAFPFSTSACTVGQPNTKHNWTAAASPLTRCAVRRGRALQHLSPQQGVQQGKLIPAELHVAWQQPCAVACSAFALSCGSSLCAVVCAAFALSPAQPALHSRHGTPVTAPRAARHAAARRGAWHCQAATTTKLPVRAMPCPPATRRYCPHAQPAAKSRCCPARWPPRLATLPACCQMPAVCPEANSQYGSASAQSAKRNHR